ncbi:MAG: hypothetical protein EA400_17045 [Chromatiaceae bacterium]|nr:MAG: hypothetical protein EA400_17045 [Chromatiaceae bacterium]
MSYILEALRKSQQARDLGTVPRLEAPPWEEPSAVAGEQVWVWLALLVALLAAALALYAALQVSASGPRPETAQAAAPAAATAPLLHPPPASTPTAPPELPLDPATAALSGPALAPGLDLLMEDLLPATAGHAEPSPQAAADPAPEPEPAPGSTAGRQPEILVVPAPPAPGQRLPRGAEELRRAVLGEPPRPAPPPTPPARAADGGPPQPTFESVPVPPELLADIEAFKQQVGAGGGTTRQPAAPPLQPPPAAPAAPAAPPARASADLRRRLPAFSMSVHVYNADPTRRFVYINGRKVGEREVTREGLRLEEVLADGAILSFGGEAFFEPR